MTIRSLLHTTFAALMCMSLFFSLAMQAGHAGMAIADSADSVTPLSAGDKAPKFVVETVNKESFGFDPENLERPVVLLTFRGGWCPYCNVHLSELRNVIPEIREMGIDVLFLSGDRAESLYDSLSLETQEDIDGLDYTILSDANAEAAIALGVAFKAGERTANYLKSKGTAYNGSSVANQGALPVPAVFIVDKAGTIRYAYSNADYKVRLPADKLVAAARDIAGN